MKSHSLFELRAHQNWREQTKDERTIFRFYDLVVLVALFHCSMHRKLLKSRLSLSSFPTGRGRPSGCGDFGVIFNNGLIDKLLGVGNCFNCCFFHAKQGVFRVPHFSFRLLAALCVGITNE